jgi:hypothetical protein
MAVFLYQKQNNRCCHVKNTNYKIHLFAKFYVHIQYSKKEDNQIFSGGNHWS